MPSEKIKNSLTLVEDDLHALYTNFTDNLIVPTSGTRTSAIYLSWVCWFCSRKSAIFHYILTWLLQEVVVAIKNIYCKTFLYWWSYEYLSYFTSCSVKGHQADKPSSSTWAWFRPPTNSLNRSCLLLARYHILIFESLF